MEWLSGKSLGFGGKKIVSEITNGGLAVEFMVVPRGEGGRDIRGEYLTGVDPKSNYRLELDARHESVVVWDLTNSRGQRNLTEMGIGEEIGFGRVKVESLEQASNLINLHSNQKSSRVLDLVIPERMLEAKKSALEMAVGDKLHPFLSTTADLISDALRDGPRRFAKYSLKKVAHSVVSIMANEDGSIRIFDIPFAQAFRGAKDSFPPNKGESLLAANPGGPLSVVSPEGGPLPVASPYRAGKEALAAQRGAILNPTAPVVGRSFRAFWDRLLGRREMITNASPNGPPAVRANGDNIDIPLADTVVRREPPAPTLHSMVGNDLGFQNGRPLSADNPNLLRGPPNQFKDFLENKINEPYVSKLSLEKKPIAISRVNQGKAESNVVVPKEKQIALYWPANEGFMQGSVLKQTRVGERIDRWGSPEGKFASPAGTPFELRGLPPKDKVSKPYFVYEVVKPFEVHSGKVMPAFGQIGQGIQYRLPMKIRELVDLGYLREVKNESR